MPNDTEEKSALHETIVIDGGSLNGLRDELKAELKVIREDIKTEFFDLKKVVKDSILKVIQAPLSVLLISGFTWLFYIKLIDQWVWGVFNVIFLFPFYGDGIKLAFEFWKKSKNGK